MLNTITNGPDQSGTPLIIVHGLYGSARNWGVIAKRLSDSRRVITVDQRNHGNSFWSDSHGYTDMAADIAEVVDSLGGHADILGHSMGGKASMVLALTQPEKVNRLIVADIAPVQYAHNQLQYIRAMRALDLSGVTTRSEADRRMRDTVPELAVRAFLLQSLDVAEGRWRLNLDALEAEMPKIMGFPDTGGQFAGPTMFLSGGASDYVQQTSRATIKGLFPSARFVKIPGAGHWLHAEKPREFEAALRAFLDAGSGDQTA